MEPLREKLLPSTARHSHQPSAASIAAPEHHSPFRGPIRSGTRTVLRVLVFFISLSIVISLSFGIWLRNATSDQTWLNEFGYRFQIWPKQFELDPTTVFLVAAGLSVLFNFVSLVTRCTGAHKKDTPLHTIASTGGLVIGLIAWIAALVYSKTWNHRASQHNWWDLWTWSCLNPDYYLAYPNGGGISFGTVCEWLKYTFWGGVIAAALELVNLILFWVHRIASRRKGKQSEGQGFELRNLMGGFQYKKMGSGEA